MGTADHAAPALHAAGAVWSGTFEERIGDRLAWVVEVHPDRRLFVGVAYPQLFAQLTQQLVGGIVVLVDDHPEHPLRGLVVGGKRLLPILQIGPLRVFEEWRRGNVERVRVAEAAATHTGAADYD